MYRPTAGFPPGRSRRSGLLVDLWILSLLLGMLQLLRSCQVEGLPQDAVFNADQVWNAPNCTNMFCTKGYECFLQEVPCTHSPCKLAAICAANKDVHKWLNDCKKLGCYASSKCFLRASHMKGARTRDRTCDCLDDSTSYYGEPKSLKFCRGWICPPNLMCYAEVEDHKVNRFCDAVRYYQELTDESMPQSSVSETLERDHLIDDLENLKVLTDSEQANAEDEEYDFLLPAANSPVSMESNQAFASIKTKRLSEIPGMKKNFGEDDSAFLIKTAGHKAVQYWIEKSRANNDQDFDDFMKWITLVESLLEPDIYRMWLQKITLATKNVPEFQSWLSMRNLGLRRTTTITRRVTNRARTVVKTNPPPPPVDTDEDTEEEEKPAVANPASPADSQPINLQAKNLFYSDKNFIFVEPSTNPNHVATFLDKQTVSSLVGNRNFVPTQYQESTTYPQQNPLPIQQYQPQQWSQQNQQQQQLPQQQMPQQQQQQQIPQQQPQMIQQQQQMPQQLQQQQPQQIPQQQPQMIQQQQPQIPQQQQQQQQQQQMPQQLQLLPQQQQPRSQPQEFPLNPQNIVTYNQARAYEDQPTYVYQALPPPLPMVTEAPNIGQGYIMADPRQMPPMMNMQRNSNPTQILLGYTEYPMAQQPENSYYLSNYSQFQNISITASPAFGVQQQIGVQPRFFFPNSQIDFGKTVQSNQWTQRWTNSIPLKRDSQLAEQQQRESSRSEDDPLTMGVGSMIGQLQGLQQMRDNLKPPNLVNLEADRPVSQMMLPNNADNNPGPMPNLLIYFPPPLNFFMYYSVKNDTNPPASVNLKTTVRPTSHRPHVSVESKSSESNEEVGFRTFTGINSESNSSEKSENKEMEYIKKIIKEMIDYWDEKEKSHQKLDDKQSQKNDEAQSTTTPKTSSTTPNLPDEQTKTPTFDAFLEWFSQNSDKKFAFSDRDLHNQRPTPESKDDTTKPPISPDSLDLRQLLGDSKDSGDKKIRILLDVDKNPELIKLLFAQNKMHNNTGDGNEYQVIVNLDDFVKPNEEDLISRRLIDIATNELHRNVTTKQEIPKVLWVFPIYDTENDAAVLSDLEKTTTEKLNAPTTPKFGNPPKRYRHRQQFDRRKNDQRSYMKLRPTQVTILQEKEYNDDSPTTQKENEYDSYDDQSYYDQRDQKSKEENSSKDESA